MTSEIEGIRVPDDSVELIEVVLGVIDSSTEHDPDVRTRLVESIAGQVSLRRNAALMPSSHEVSGGIFADSSNLEHRLIRDYDKLNTVVEGLRAIGTKIVLTSGSFDMLHVGHTGYLETARRFGDLLIVGVDSDAKIKAKKGPNRPIIPEHERLQMLSHVRGVGLITLKNLDDTKWQLIKAVHPDTLIATEGTYSNEEVIELETNYCGQIVVLPPQSTTSTSAKIRQLQMGFASGLGERILTTIADYIKGND